MSSPADLNTHPEFEHEPWLVDGNESQFVLKADGAQLVTAAERPLVRVRVVLRQLQQSRGAELLKHSHVHFSGHLLRVQRPQLRAKTQALCEWVFNARAEYIFHSSY